MNTSDPYFAGRLRLSGARRLDLLNRKRPAPQVRYLAIAILLACLCCVGAGCADNRQSDESRTTMEQRQEAALQDPFSVQPDTQPHDVSGGDIKTLDRKALKRDLDTIFNP